MGERLVRTGSFVRAELVSTLRQPRLLFALVLGPFLVLFVFGLGYQHELPVLSTVVVGAAGDELTARVDDYVRQEEPAEIAYEGTTEDEAGALHRLRQGEVDLVIVLPRDALDTLGQSERAVIEVHQRSLDPITDQQVRVAAQFTVTEINQDVLEQVVAAAQARTDGVEDQVTAAREQLDTLQGRIDGADAVAVRRTSGELATRFEQLARTLEGGGGFVGRLGFGDDLDELLDGMRTVAEQLRRVSTADVRGELAQASDTLAELDEVLAFVQGVDPAVAVRPFDSQIVSAAPVAITLDRFFAPGLVALMLQHLGVTFAALSLVREREVGTLDVLRVAPVSTGERLAGKSIAFILIGAVVAVALTALSVLAFDVPLPVDWLAFSGLITLTLLASLGIGFLVAAVSKSHSQAVQYAMLLLLTAIFFAGLFMPLERIGMPVEAVSWLLPATYGFRGLQHLVLLAQPVPWLLYVGLAALAVVTFGLARLLLVRRPG